MNKIIGKLHKDFSQLVSTKLIDQWYYESDSAKKNLHITNNIKQSTAFFLDYDVSYSDEIFGINSFVNNINIPFSSFWICCRRKYRTKTMNDFVHFERVNDDLTIRIYTNHGQKKSWNGTVFKFEGSVKSVDDFSVVDGPLIRHTLKLVDEVNSSRKDIEPPSSILVRRKLTLAGRVWKQNKFITVRPNRSSSPSRCGNGSPKSPHNRRGHWRNYQSGKTVWVGDCTIRGGSTASKLYAMKK